MRLPVRPAAASGLASFTVVMLGTRQTSGTEAATLSRQENVGLADSDDPPPKGIQGRSAAREGGPTGSGLGFL